MIEQIGTADIYDSEGRGLLHYAAFSGQRDMIGVFNWTESFHAYLR